MASAGKKRLKLSHLIRIAQWLFLKLLPGFICRRGDHKAIATKMAAYFQEFLRTNYYLNPRMSREELIDTLSRKSGVAPEHTSSLLDALDKLPNAKNNR